MNLRRLAVVGVTLAAGLGAGSVHADPETVIVGTNRADQLVGSADNDVIIGLRGADLLIGLRGDDVLLGGPGGDTLRAWGPRGDSGQDILSGGPGRDRCTGDVDDVFVNCEVVRIRPD